MIMNTKKQQPKVFQGRYVPPFAKCLDFRSQSGLLQQSADIISIDDGIEDDWGEI